YTGRVTAIGGSGEGHTTYRLSPHLAVCTAFEVTRLRLLPVHTVAVLSLKGGVGKTTVVLGLASAALRRGVRTLVVDLDPQCNATATLEPDETEATLSDVLEDPTPSVLRA